MVSCSAAFTVLFALSCVNHARYGACAATYDSALGPTHAPACTDPNTAVSSSATDAYSELNRFHAPAAASKDPGPGPLLSNAECTSGGDAIQIGAVTAASPRRATPYEHPSAGDHQLRRLLNLKTIFNTALRTDLGSDQGTPPLNPSLPVPHHPLHPQLPHQ